MFIYFYNCHFIVKRGGLKILLEVKMSLKELFGLSDENISDSEIIDKLKQAQKNNLSTVEFTKKDGSKVMLMLSSVDLSATTPLGE